MLTQDGVSGVVGRIGAAPAELPAADLGPRPRHQAADGPALAGRRRARDRVPTGSSALSAVAAPAIVQALYGALDGSPVRQSSDMCLRISVRNRKKPLGFCNTYVGGGGSTDALAGGPLVSDAAAATQILDAYDAGPLPVTGVQVGLRVARGLRIATLRRLSGPASVHRGSTISVRATLAAPRWRHAGPHTARPRAARCPARAADPLPEGDGGRRGVRRVRQRRDDDRSVIAVRARQPVTSRRARDRSPRWRARCRRCIATTASRRASCRRARRCRRICPAAPRASRSARAASSATRCCASRAGPGC